MVYHSKYLALGMYEKSGGDCLFDYLLYFSLVWRRHHRRGRAAKIRRILKVFSRVWRSLYRATPVVTQGPLLSVASFDTQGDVEDPFLPGSSHVKEWKCELSM
jgi:hypothetical protein